jgi:hypothetical protein
MASRNESIGLRIYEGFILLTTSVRLATSGRIRPIREQVPSLAVELVQP